MVCTNNVHRVIKHMLRCNSCVWRGITDKPSATQRLEPYPFRALACKATAAYRATTLYNRCIGPATVKSHHVHTSSWPCQLAHFHRILRNLPCGTLLSRSNITSRAVVHGKHTVTELAAPVASSASDLPTLLSKLNTEQALAVSSEEKCICVKAGPGSGKTRVITTRVARLIGYTGVLPQKILVITFSRKAAKEIKERLALMLGQGVARRVAAGTFHSLCAGIIRAHVDRLQNGLDQRYSIVEQEDAEGMVAQVLHGLSDLEAEQRVALAQRLAGPQGSQKTVKQMLAAVTALSRLEPAKRSKLSDWLAGLMDYVTSEQHTVHSNQDVGWLVHALIQQWRLPDIEGLEPDHLPPQLLHWVFTQYKESLYASNVVDFSDLLSMAVHLLKTHEDIRREWQGKFEHVLVDEFQDTNTPQYTLVKLLKGDTGNLFVVGDPDQAIYRFRGANPTIMLETFPRDYPHASLVYLTGNYRSAPQVLRTASVVLAAGGLPRMHMPLKAVQPKPGGVRHVTVPDQEWEQAYVAGEIRRLHKTGQPYKDMAILVRFNKQAEDLATALRLGGIPSQVLGTSGLFKRAVVKDMMASLRWVLNPSDALALARVCKALSGTGKASSKMAKPPGTVSAKAKTKTKAHRMGAGDATIAKLRAAAQAADVSWAALVCSDLKEVWMTHQEMNDLAKGFSHLSQDQDVTSLLPKHLIPSINNLLPSGTPKLRSDVAEGVDNLRALLVVLRSAAYHQGVPAVMDCFLTMGRYDQNVDDKGTGYINILKDQASDSKLWLADGFDFSEDTSPSDSQAHTGSAPTGALGSPASLSLKAQPLEAKANSNGLGKGSSKGGKSSKATAMQSNSATSGNAVITTSSNDKGGAKTINGNAKSEGSDSNSITGSDSSNQGLDDLSAFLNHLLLSESLEDKRDAHATDEVQIMTLHKSKGCEYPTVFIPGLEEECIPWLRSKPGSLPANEAEEKRLLYVGCTRAMERLYLITCRNRFLHGQFLRPKQSRFVDALQRATKAGERKGSNAKFITFEGDHTQSYVQNSWQHG